MGSIPLRLLWIYEIWRAPRAREHTGRTDCGPQLPGRRSGQYCRSKMHPINTQEI